MRLKNLAENIIKNNLLEQSNSKGVVVSNSYSKNYININPDNKSWRNKLPKLGNNYSRLFHNTLLSNKDKILSGGLRVNRLSRGSGYVDDYFSTGIISHRLGTISFIVDLTPDEWMKLQYGVVDGKKYNITLKNGIIPPQRILGYIEIPNTNDGHHNESLVFYKNSKYNPKVDLDIIQKEMPMDDSTDDNPLGTQKASDSTYSYRKVDINPDWDDW